MHKTTPYKNPEKQKQAVRETSRRYMARKRRMRNIVLEQLDTLGVGVPYDLGMMQVEDTKTGKRCKPNLLPVDPARKLGDLLKSKTPMRLVMTKRFIVCRIPRDPIVGSEADKKILEIVEKIQELGKLVEAEEE